MVEVAQDGRGGESLEHRAHREAFVGAVRHRPAGADVVGEHAQARGVLLLQFSESTGEAARRGMGRPREREEGGERGAGAERERGPAGRVWRCRGRAGRSGVDGQGSSPSGAARSLRSPSCAATTGTLCR
ncbi:hypothetical protein BN2537_15009 [Streptomyces venezuelae]|nr:hypothetical protein BN2537_15009 [Streptomyces venezuelae]